MVRASSAQGSLFLQGEQNVLLAHLGGKLGELTDLENNATTIWGRIDSDA